MSHALNIDVYQYNKKGELVNKYTSVVDASKNIGISESLISSVMNGTGNTGGGFILRHEETEFTKEEINLLYNPPHSTSLRLIQYSKSGVEIKRYDNAVQAGKELKIDQSSITKVCRGVNKMCGGFKWKYECQENTDKEQVIKRLTPEQNNEIIKKRKEGFTVKELAKEYSKSSSQITRIVRNKV